MSEDDASPSQAPPRPLWSRIAAPFTAHRITATFTIVLAVATLGLVGVAYIQHFDSVEAIAETKRLATATEGAVAETKRFATATESAVAGRRRIASAELVLKYDDILDRSRYRRIITDIETHGSNYPLLSRKKKGRVDQRSDADIEEYIGVFEDLGYFIEDDLIIAKMAYDRFSYNIEKAWCNRDVQRVIQEARAADRSDTAKTEPFYVNFEKLAQKYLAKEGQTCKDLENQ